VVEGGKWDVGEGEGRMRGLEGGNSGGVGSLGVRVERGESGGGGEVA